MNLFALGLLLMLGQTSSDPNSIHKTDLPLTPLEHKQIVIADSLEWH